MSALFSVLTVGRVILTLDTHSPSLPISSSCIAPLNYIIIASKHLSALFAANDQDCDASVDTTPSFRDGTGASGGDIILGFNSVLPFEIGFDTTMGGIGAVGKQFILCPYNQHNMECGMHRSPWSNSYFPSASIHRNKMEIMEEKGVDDGMSETGIVPRSSHTKINDKLRSLEIYANELFDIYRTLYYGKKEEGGEEDSVCSVYLWENCNTGQLNKGDVDLTMKQRSSGEERMREESREIRPEFGGCILIQNRVIDPHDDNDDDNEKSTSKNDEIFTAYWNSIHELSVSVSKTTNIRGSVAMGENQHSTSNAIYKISSTILLSVTTSMSPTAAATATAAGGARKTIATTMTNNTEVCGSLTRHTVRECNYDHGGDIYDHSHIHNIGKYIEEVESHMRSELDALYLSRLRTTALEFRMGKEDMCPIDKVVGRERTSMREGDTDYSKELSEAVRARARSTKTEQ